MDVTRHIEKAAEAVRKKNYDYAISLYRQVLLYDSKSGKARRGLREAEFRKYEKGRSPALVRMFTTAPARLMALVHGMFKNHEKLTWDLESILQRDPHNLAAHLKLGRAALLIGDKETAKVAYEGALQAAPTNAVAAKSLGKLLAEEGDLPNAFKWYEEALKINPQDQEAIKARKNLAAEGALRAGYEGAKSSMDLVKDKDRARELHREERMVFDADEAGVAIRELEAKVAQNPKDRKARERLGELHEGQRNVAAALKVFEELLAEDQGNFDLRARVGDLKLASLEAQVGAQRGQGGAALAGAQKELLGMRVSEFRWRVKEHPTDLALRFQLGEALQQSGLVDEAVGEFQQTVKDPRRRLDSLVMLGECFLKKGMTELAVAQFGKALDGLSEGNRRAMEVRYTLARVHEESGDRAKARAEYLKIFERDINYKDVKARLEALPER
jgi:tetratricopeptide (TPR) repeat protein